MTGETLLKKRKLTDNPDNKPLEGHSKRPKRGEKPLIKQSTTTTSDGS